MAPYMHEICARNWGKFAISKSLAFAGLRLDKLRSIVICMNRFSTGRCIALTVLSSVHHGTDRAGACNQMSAAGCRHDTAFPAYHICGSDSSEHRAAFTEQKPQQNCLSK